MNDRGQHGGGDAQAWIDWLDSGAWERTLDSTNAMIPALAVEVARIAQDPDVSAIRLTQVISKDPIMAANVVRLANSAFSASATTITSLSDAVVRVGTRAVRQLVTASCLTSELRNPRAYGAAAREMVDHAIGTAYLAWLVADRVDEDSDAAFLCGLLHDIGKFVLLKLAYQDRPVPASMTEARLAAVVQARHAAIGGRALARWMFADEIRLPVTWHHEPAQAHGHLPQAAITYAANRLSHRYGFGCSLNQDSPLDDVVFVKLGIDADFLAELDGKAPGLYEVARKIAA
ncbi:MAG: HDOD domain-containing protein [Vicinamibacterales bacterium]